MWKRFLILMSTLIVILATQIGSKVSSHEKTSPPILDCTGEKGADTGTVLAAQKAWAKFLGEPSFVKSFPLTKDGKTTIETCLVPPGKYYHGKSDKQTLVTITKPMWVSRCEVTQSQYRAVMEYNPSNCKKTGDEAAIYPVESVSHNACVKFNTRASTNTGFEFRLLSDAEWEYAYRAGTRTQYYNGDSADKLGEIAYFDENNKKHLGKVGTKLPNAFGLHDMAGNVWEWCADWKADAQTTSTDPRGPATGELKVIRGGGFNDLSRSCTASHSLAFGPNDWNDLIGFRIVVVSATAAK
ncbi:MAG: formylglycine-generating enzyme family protein [Fimbriiglobus sp.]